MTYPRLLLLLVVLLGSKQLHADVYDVYLLAGQSNMDGRGDADDLSETQRRCPADAMIFYRNPPHASDGWSPLATGFSVPPKFKGALPSTKFGPEIGFAATVARSTTANKLGLIKGAKGGTSLRVDWNPGRAGEPDSQGPCYRDFIETIELATSELTDKGHSYVIRGLLWHQGESDSRSSEQRYRMRLTELINRIRQDVGNPDLPVVIGEVFDNGRRDTVRAAQRGVGSSMANVEVAPARGLTTWDEGTHLDAQSQWQLGQRFATALSKCSNPKRLKPANGPHEKPNVLFISVDDLNDWEGSLGGNPQAQTPHMDKLFHESVLFTNAHCSQAVCTASRNSLLSGIHPSRSGWYVSTAAMRKSYDEVMGDHKMLPQYFRDHGYETFACGKVFHQGVSDYKDRTKDFWDETAPTYKVPKELLARGDGYGGKMFYPFPKRGSQIVDRYGEEYADGHSLCYGALDRDDIPGGMMFDELTADWASEQLRRDHTKPFFLAVGFVRPHVPYTAPREFFDLYNLDDIQLPDVPNDEMADIPMMGKSIGYGTLPAGDHYAVVNLSDSYWREMIYGYLACVSFADAQVGKVLDALANSQHAENTIVVLWSDHGQHLGEKKHWRKQSLWEESTRVPLCIRLPGQATGSSCSEAVSLLDVYPTLIDLCGLPATAELDGASLLPQIQDHKTPRDTPVLSTWYYRNHSVRSNDWRYIRYRDGTEELYDHRSDPGEHTNLAGLSEFADVVAEHRRWLPKIDALPAGEDRWEGDKLDRRVREWTENESVPAWLK